MRRFFLIAVFGSLTQMVACAGMSGTTPKIVTNADPAADFGRFQTFAFVQPLGTDRRGTSTSLSMRLRVATTRELQRIGLNPVSNSPDLLINFLNATESRPASTNMSSSSPSIHHARTGYVTWNGYPMNSSTTRVITEGSIGIDIVDAANHRLIWEGAATGRVTESMRDNPDETIDSLVSAILAEFPYNNGK